MSKATRPFADYKDLTWSHDREEIIDIVEAFYLDDPDQKFSQVYLRVIADMPNLQTTENALRKALDRRHDRIGMESFNHRYQKKQLMYERRALEKRARDEAWQSRIGAELARTHTTPITFAKPLVKGQGTRVLKRVRYVISDEHYLGDVSSPIIDACWQTIYDDVLLNGYEELSLVFLGDPIEGIIHQNSWLNGNEGIVRATRKLIDRYVSWIKLVAGLSLKTHVFWVNKSNHGQIRTFGAKRSDYPQEDVGDIIGDAIKTCVKDHGKGRVTYTTGDDEGKIIDGQFMYLHGHQSFAGRSRIERSVNTIEDVRANVETAGDYLKRKRIRYVIMGHWHEFWYRQTGFGFLIIAPALKDHRTAFDLDRNYHPKPAILKLVGENAENVKYIEIKKKKER